MKLFLKTISASIFFIFLPVFVFSAISGFLKSGSNNTVYDFEVHADVPVGGFGGGGGAGCQGAPGCCNN